MKNLFFALFFFGFCIMAGAQTEPNVGDELTVNASNTYRFIKFPKPNILIKRGTVTGYKSVYGDTVVVNEVIKKDNGDVYVELKKKDGTKFFGQKTTVKANYAKALEAGELMKAKS